MSGMDAFASRVKMIADKIEELKEQNQLKEFKHYFLWKLGQDRATNQ